MSWMLDLLTTILSRKGASEKRGFLQNQVSSLVNKYTGAGLTGAEQEANQFTAEQAEQANERNVFNYQHRYQWEVDDMQKAGLNPALLYGGSSGAGSVSSAPAGSSVSPASSGMSDLVGSIMDLALLKAQIKNINADTRSKNASAVGQEITNTNLDDTQKATIANILASAESTKADTLYRNLLIKYGLPEAEVNKILNDIKVGDSTISRNEAESELAKANTAYQEVRKKIDLDKLPYELANMSASARESIARSIVEEFRGAYMRQNNTDVPSGAIASLVGMLTNTAHSVANESESGWSELNARTFFPFIDMLLNFFNK